MHEDKAHVRVVRPLDRSVLGQEEEDFIPLPITDDRDCDYVDPRLRDVADLVIHIGRKKLGVKKEEK